MALIVIDENNSIFLRMGTNIIPVSAMCYWNNKLVIGCGYDESDTATVPNLLYFDEDVETEIAAVDSVANTITSDWYSKVYDLSEHNLADVEKQLRQVDVKYYDNIGYEGTVTISYKIDDGNWTSLGTITMTTSEKTMMQSFRVMSAYGYGFQLKFTSTDKFKILGYKMYFHIGSKK